MNLSIQTKTGSYTFSSIQEVMGKASDFRSGDRLADAAAADGAERMAAKRVLAGLTVHDITENPAVPYEKDSVTRIIMDDLDRAAYASIQGKTIGELREWLLSTTTSGDQMLSAGRGMTSEVIAAVSKLMDNGGWISKDEILGILHDTYDYAAEPEFVLHDLVDNWKFIIVDGEILRLTKEGDKVADKGVECYAAKERFWDRTVKMKAVVSIISALIAAIGVLISWIICLIS